MKFIFLLILFFIFSFNIYAQDNISQQKNSEVMKNFNIMEVFLFLNCNMLPPGAASYKADKEKKIVQYFDTDGILMEEHYLDKNNVAVYKEYDKSGQVIVEKKLSEEDFRSMVNKHATEKNIIEEGGSK
ncbi:MAG: hypothetical protein AB1472_06875 [Candidatus Omnitrophota bacterium]